MGRLFEVLNPQIACGSNRSSNVSNRTYLSLGLGVVFFAVALTAKSDGDKSLARQLHQPKMQQPGLIEGTVRDEETGTPLGNQGIDVWRSDGELLGSTLTNQAGAYSFPAGHGLFFVSTATTHHQNEIFDDIPCRESNKGGCDPTTGSPIEVFFESRTLGIDFRLRRLGTIAGQITNQVTGNPAHPASVYVYDPSGQFVTLAETDEHGYYETESLPASTYFAITNTFESLPDEIYMDLPCTDSLQCDPTSGTPIEVVNDVTTTNIDFALGYLQGIIGRLTNLLDGAPLQAATVDLWDEDGKHAAFGKTNVNGMFRVRVPPGTYFVSTRNELGFEDAIFDGVACPEGPAYGGSCNPLSGVPVAVSAGEFTSGVRFQLHDLVFTEGFEPFSL